MNYVEHLNLFSVEAKEIPCVRDSGAPTESTVGAVGLLYMDTDTGDMYKCTAVNGDIYTWVDIAGSGVVFYNAVQELTDEEKAQARENIGAMSSSTSPLPEVTTADNGKILQVVDGTWLVTSLENSSVKTYIDEYISSALEGDY